MPHARAQRRPAKAHSPTTLLLIALFKLVKGLLLVAAGVGALKLLHHDVAETLNRWVYIIHVDPDNRYIHRLLSRVLSASPKQLRAVSAGTFIYAALLLTEGVGLLLRKRWAEYFTLITTAGLIPLEIYELARRMTAAKVGVLIVNVAIVVYLAMRIKRSGSGRG
jgi:uncharacterized membrane protein (DUF2068 family)